MLSLHDSNRFKYLPVKCTRTAFTYSYQPVYLTQCLVDPARFMQQI